MFIRLITQGRPGCDLGAYERLKTLASNDVVRLLVPEIVLLELDKHRRGLTSELVNKIGGLRKHINTFAYWSEIADLRGLLLELVDKEKQAKLERSTELFDDVLSFLRSQTELSFTADVLCRAQKRIMAGRMPRSVQNSSNDAGICESLICYFEAHGSSADELLFCSGNHSDFAERVHSSTKDRNFKLSALIADSLPPTKYYLDLDSLLAFDDGYERAFVSGMPPLDFDPDDQPDWELIEQQSHKEIEAHFSADVLPRLPADIVQRRKTLVSDIQAILAECRACSSWDAKSEEKLGQWLDFVAEYAIPYTSVSNLVTIEESLGRYLEIHQQMDAG